MKHSSQICEDFPGLSQHSPKLNPRYASATNVQIFWCVPRFPGLQEDTCSLLLNFEIPRLLVLLCNSLSKNVNMW